MAKVEEAVDASLENWSNIRDQYDWKGILIGNGGSRAVWDDFAYSSLFEQACESIEHPLTAEDIQIFDDFNKTRNFEMVLNSLATARRIDDIVGLPSDRIVERYRSIQRALVEAIHAVHVPWVHIPAHVFQMIRAELQAYDYVFTTNYDLLLYWSIMHEHAAGFKDFFWGEGHTFDITDVEIYDNHVTKILYLHGALHLYRTYTGETAKDSSNEVQNLLDRFQMHINKGEIPLFISEGTPEDKRLSINSSDYLSFAYRTFSDHSAPLAVFGHSLSESDSHLLDAIRSWNNPTIAISIFTEDPTKIMERKVQLMENLEVDQLIFFDARTHPLGTESLKLNPTS